MKDDLQTNSLQLGYLNLREMKFERPTFEPYLIALILMKCLLNTLHPILLL